MNSVRIGWWPALLLGALVLAPAAPARAQEGRPGPRRMAPGARARPEEMCRAIQEVVIREGELGGAIDASLTPRQQGRGPDDERQEDEP